MSQVISLLRSGANFLSLSRQQPQLFEQVLQYQLSNGVQVTIHAEGIIEFKPAHNSAKDIVYSCGVHGNETAPIEICDELVSDILSGELALKHRLLVIFGNLPAMDIAQRFVHENMNRLFDGEHANPQVETNPERVRAALLEQCVANFFNVEHGQERERYHYDLHTAIRDSKNEKFAVYPFLHGRKHKAEQLQFLLACGVNTILLSESPTTTFSYHSSKHFHADAFTVELGKVMPFGENDMTRFAGARTTLRAFVSETELSFPDYNEAEFFIYRVNQVINKQHDDFELCFSDAMPNFSDFKKGDQFARETGATYAAEQDGEAIVFPNANVAIGQRALLTVVPTSLFG
ncbi:MAG: succinylglutamate desuccinylase [Alteromonadaceae bacterium]|nr:succinylglutamate desuccinylase [Alteromonadaceae bacterium]